MTFEGDLGGPLVCEINGKEVLIGVLDIINDKTEKIATASSLYVEVAKIKPWISSIIGYERGLDGAPWNMDRKNQDSNLNPNLLTILILVSLKLRF